MAITRGGSIDETNNNRFLGRIPEKEWSKFGIFTGA